MGESNRMLWIGVSSVVMGLIHQVQEAIKFTNELNTAMTNIGMITGKSSSDIQAMTRDYSLLAGQLHDTTSSVMKASEEFLRAGHSHQETLELIKASTMMSKISGEDQKSTADQLIAITNGYKMEISDVIGVVDKLTTVDNKSATSTKELGQAIEKTASSAQSAGVPFEKLVSYIATVSSVTRQSASTIGNAFKTIFARYQDVRIGKEFDAQDDPISKVADDMERFAKINILNKQTGEFKDFGNVIEELGTKWKTLSQVEQGAIAKSLAGTYQRERFLVLMNNMGTALELQEAQLESAGSAEKRYGVFAESTNAKINDLTNALQKLYQQLLSSEGINIFLTGLKNIVEWTAKAVDSVGGIIPIILGVSAAMIALTVSTGALTAALGTLTAAGIAFNVTTAGIPILIGAAVTGIAALIVNYDKLYDKYGQLFGAVEKYKDSKVQEISQTTESLKSKQDESNEIDSLISKYDELKKQTNLNIDQKNQLKTIEEKLISIYPNLKGGIDTVTGAYDIQRGAIQNLNDTQKQYVKDMANITMAQAQSQLDLASNEEKTAKERMENSQKFITFASEFQTTVAEKAKSKSLTSKELQYYTGKGLYQYDVSDSSKLAEQINKDINNQKLHYQEVISKSTESAKKMIEAKHTLDEQQKILKTLKEGTYSKPQESIKTHGESPVPSFGDDKKGTSTTERIDKEVDEKLLIRDSYEAINIQIERQNALIEQNKALQENAPIEEKNKLLLQQIENYKTLQSLTAQKASQTRNERLSLVDSMKKQGVGFTGSGDAMSATNVGSVLQSQVDLINAHKKDKDKSFYNSQKTIYDEMVANFKRFDDIQTKELPQLGISWQKLAKDIGDTGKTIEINKIDILLEKFQASLDPLNEKVKDLKNNFDFLGDDQHAEKVSNLTEQMNTQISVVDVLSNEIKALENELNGLTEGTGVYKIVSDKLRNKNDEQYSARKSLADMSKTRKDQQIEDIFQPINNSADEYNTNLEHISANYDLLHEKDFAGKNESIQKQLQLVNEQLQKDAHQYSIIDKIKNTSITSDDSFKKKKDELSKSIENEAKKFADLTKTLKENNLNDIKNQVENLNRSFESFSEISKIAEENVKFLKEWKPKDYDTINNALTGSINSNKNAVTALQGNILTLQSKIKTATDPEQFDEWNKALQDSYNNEAEYLSKISQSQKEILSNQFNKANQDLEKSLFGDSSVEEEKRKIDKLKKSYEEYIDGQEKQYTLQAIRNELDAWNNTMENQKITMFDTQISQMQAMNEISRSNVELLQKQIEIQKLQMELDNEKNQKTIAVIRKQGDGTYKWVDEVDQKKILETQDKLSQAQIGLAKYKREQSLEEQEQQLADKEDIMNRVKEIQQKALDGQYESQDDFNRDMDDLQSDLNGQYKTSWSKNTSITDTAKNSIRTILNTMSNNYSTYSVTTIQTMTEFNKLYAQQIDSAVLKTQEYVKSANDLASALAQVEALRVKLASQGGGGGSVGGDFSGGSSSDISGNSISDWASGAFNNTVMTTSDYMNYDPSGSSSSGTSAFFNSIGYDTGGYTGDNVPSSGAVALLHNKELVLNSMDTKNILESIRLNRNQPQTTTSTSNVQGGTTYNVNVGKVVSENADKFWKQLNDYTKKLR